MTRTAVALALVLLAPALGGCLGQADPDEDPADGPAGTLDHEAIAAEIGEPVEMDHDHTDARLHDEGHNVEVVAWDTLGVELGVNGFADFVFHEDEEAGEELAFVAIDGDERGGFSIVDVSDPEDMEVLGEYRIDGSGIQEVVVTPDGQYALMNVQTIPGTEEAEDCQVCIHIVDVSDRSNPQRVGVHPVELIGTHNIETLEHEGDTYVFYTGQPVHVPVTGGEGQNTPPGNRIGVGQLVETPDGAEIVDVSEFRHEEAHTDERDNASFPHDFTLDEHPITGDRTLYGAWWNGGAITADASDPMAIQEQDVVRSWAPSEALKIHQYKPEPGARGDRLIAWSTPEIGQLESGSGVVRAYDATDPTAVEQIGTWSLPGNVTIPRAYLTSPHTVDANLEEGLLAVGHYHAGVWVLDISDPGEPRPLGYRFPVGEPGEPYTGDYWWKKPNFDPDGYVPNVFQTKWKDGKIWVTERGTGLYVLDYAGPTPGPVEGAR
jgi:hypothetical protein